MPRIFLSLAAADLILLCGAGVLALSESAPTPDRHILLAVLSLLLSCLIQVLAFTYLTVTGKMIAQAVHLARLDDEVLTRCKRWKSMLTVNLAVAFASIVPVVATGAISWRNGTPTWTHRAAAVFTVAVHLLVWRGEHRVLVENARALDHTLRAYTAWKTHAPAVSA